jgi:hypothetical protein
VFSTAPAAQRTEQLNVLFFFFKNAVHAHFDAYYLNTTMPTDYNDIERRIREALDSIPEGETPNISRSRRTVGPVRQKAQKRGKHNLYPICI